MANHLEASHLLKDSEGRVIGARCVDRITGRGFDVHARVVVNATGPYVDRLRRLSDPGARKAVTTSSGAHVTLPDYYGGRAAGMIVPKTKVGDEGWEVRI